MKKNSPIIISSVLLFLLSSDPGFCLNSSDIVRLKKAELADETIALMMKEKTVETCAFTVDEIVDLKKAGLSNKTIQMLIIEGSFMKASEPIVYGKDIRSIKFTTAKDIIELKNAGLSEKTIQAIIVFNARDVDEIEREKAREMLSDMGIIVDLGDYNDRDWTLPGKDK